MLLVDVDTQAATLGGVCVAVSNNGVGKDYCYVVENCCSVEQLIILNNELILGGSYVAESVVCLDAGFNTSAGFYAGIEDCP